MTFDVSLGYKQVVLLRGSFARKEDVRDAE